MRINSLVDPAELEKETATLSPEESHHLARVLRVREGQPIRLFDGRGNAADGIIETVDRRAVQVRVGRRWTEPPPAVHIELVQALPKPERWDLVLQKAVELGASAIRPLITARTVVRSPERRFERWRRIMINAAQQCEAYRLPELHPPQKLSEALAAIRDFDLVLVGSLYEGARPLREALRSAAAPKRAALLIGPEGDFTEEEVAEAAAAGAVPVSFGRRVLRTETAAIFGLSVLAYELL